jgi:hypothetical protein
MMVPVLKTANRQYKKLQSDPELEDVFEQSVNEMDQKYHDSLPCSQVKSSLYAGYHAVR